MIKLLIPAALLILGWIVLLFLARRNENKVRSDWQTLLSPSSEKIFRHARVEIETHTSMVGLAMNEAVAIKQLGDIDEALRFVKIGGDVIQRFTPNLLALLAIMMRFSRMVGAMAPIKPLIPQDFHLSELSSLAYLDNWIHQVLVSAKQRFKLKLFVIAKGVSITSRYLMLKIKALVTRRSADDQEWEEIMNIGQDFQKLSEESVKSFHELLEALSQDSAKELANNLSLTRKTDSSVRSLT